MSYNSIIKKLVMNDSNHGWTKELENKNLFERCHILHIAYKQEKQIEKIFL